MTAVLPRRVLLRYSLRSALIAISVVAIYLGLWMSASRRNSHAADVLTARGVTMWDGYEEPVGPNWLYGWTYPFSPHNGHFPEWFAKSLCISGNTTALVRELALTGDDWQLFRDLVNFRTLSVDHYHGDENWLSHLRGCRDLRFLEIASTPLTSDDISRLANLKLSKLILTDTGLDAEQIEAVRARLPGCEVIETNAENSWP